MKAVSMPRLHVNLQIKGWFRLTRHRQSKHETAVTANIPPINMEIVKNILRETADKLREEYLSEINSGHHFQLEA